MRSIDTIHLINFSRKLTINTLLFLIPLYLLNIGFSGWQIGVIASIFASAPILFSFPTGWINDRLSIRRVIQSSLGVVAFLFLIIGLTRDFVFMALIFLLLGVAHNALDISTNSMYYKDETAMDLNRRFGVLNLWLCLGMALGVLFGGILTFYTGFRVMFLFYSLYLFMILLLVRDLPEERFSSISIREYKLELVNKKTILFTILIFVLTLHWGVEGTVYSPFLKEVFHLNTLQLALYIAIPLFFLALAAFSLVFFRYHARNNERLFIISMAISGFGHIMMVTRHLYVSFFFRIVHEIGDGIMAALIFVFISRLFEKKSIGGSSGMLIAVMTLGHMVGAILFAAIGFHLSLAYPFVISGILLMANALFGYWIFRTQRYA